MHTYIYIYIYIGQNADGCEFNCMKESWIPQTLNSNLDV